MYWIRNFTTLRAQHMAPWRPSSCTRRPAEFHSPVACCGTIGLLPQRTTASQGAPWNPQSHTLVKPRSVPGRLELVENEIRASLCKPGAKWPKCSLEHSGHFWTQLGSFYFVEFILRVARGISIRLWPPAWAPAFFGPSNVAHGPNHAQPVPRGLHLPGMEHMENIWKTMRFEMFMIFRGRDKLSRTVSLFFDLL